MQNKKMFNYNPEKIKEEQNNILKEIEKTDINMIENNRKRILKILLIIVIIFILIKLIFGTIEINNPLGYPPDKTRFYYVTLNEKAVNVTYKLKHKFPIIPFLVNFVSTYYGNNRINEENSGVFVFDSNLKNLNLKIDSYKCYANKIEIECLHSDQKMEKVKNPKYTNMKIVTNDYDEKIIYEGNIVNDLKPYINKKGDYKVFVTNKYNFVETVFYFYIKVI